MARVPPSTQKGSITDPVGSTAFHTSKVGAESKAKFIVLRDRKTSKSEAPFGADEDWREAPEATVLFIDFTSAGTPTLADMQSALDSASNSFAEDAVLLACGDLAGLVFQDVARIGLAKIVAFAPDTAIDMTKFTKEASQGRSSDIWLLFDPRLEKDHKTAQASARNRSTTLLRVPFAGTRVVMALRQADMLTSTIAQIQEGTFDRSAFDSRINDRLEQSAIAVFNRSKVAKFSQRLELTARAHALDPLHQGIAYRYGIQLLRRRRIHEAETALRTVFCRETCRDEFVKGYIEECKNMNVKPRLLIWSHSVQA